MNKEARTPSARAWAGLGKGRVEQWWLEGVTAITLVPFTVWFAVSIVVIYEQRYAAFIGWLKTPAATILTALFFTGSSITRHSASEW